MISVNLGVIWERSAKEPEAAVLQKALTGKEHTDAGTIHRATNAA